MPKETEVFQPVGNLKRKPRNIKIKGNRCEIPMHESNFINSKDVFKMIDIIYNIIARTKNKIIPSIKP